MNTPDNVTNKLGSYSVQYTVTEKKANEIAKFKNEIETKYPGLRFDYKSLENTEQIKNYAKQQYGYGHVTIPPQLLEKMMSDEKIKQKIENMLENIEKNHKILKVMTEVQGKDVIGVGTVFTEEGDVSTWVSAEKQNTEPIFQKPIDNSYSYQEKKDKNEENARKKAVFTVVYHYTASSDMIRIAKADSMQSVRGIIASKRGEINKVKSLVEDKTEAMRIISKIKSVIRKGSMKLSRLHKEEDLELQRRIAEKRFKVSLERELREDLRRKRVARKSQENSETADISDIFVRPNENDLRYQYGLNQYEAALQIDSVSAMGCISDGGAITISDGGGMESASIDVIA